MRKVIFALTLSAAAAASQAQIAFSNFGPGDSFNSGVSWVIDGPGATNPQIIAHQFTSAASGQLDYVKFAFVYFQGDSTLNVELLNDDGSDQLGTSITTWSFAADGNPGNATVMSLPNGFPSITLTAGQKYWVKLFGEGTFSGGWNWNDQNVSGPMAFSTNGGSSYSYSGNETMAAFEVGLTAVPEPATLATLGLGAVALLRRRRR